MGISDFAVGLRRFAGIVRKLDVPANWVGV